MAKPSKKNLEFTVKDLNKVLKLSPTIETASVEQMETDIKEIEELLTAADIEQLNKKSKKVMTDLGITFPEVDGDEEENGDGDGDGEEENDEEKPEPKPKRKGKAKPVAKKKDTKKEQQPPFFKRI